MVTGSILRPSLVLGLLICRCGVCVQHPRTYTATLQLQRYEPVTPTPLQHPSPYSSDTPAVPMPHIPATHQEHPRAPAAPTHSYITHSPAAPSYVSPSLSTAVPPQSAQRGCLSLQYSRCGGLAFPEPWGGWRARAGAGGGGGGRRSRCLSTPSQREPGQSPCAYPTELQKNLWLPLMRNWRVGLEQPRTGPCGDWSLTLLEFKAGKKGE